MTPEEFTKIFETSYQEALENIMNSPFRNSSRSKHGKVDNQFQSKISAIVSAEFENIEFEGELSAKLFLSVLQDAPTEVSSENRAQLYQKNATKLDSTMTDSDQSVLYYITGYIISKLQKKTFQHKNLKNQKIREAMTNFVVKQSTMLQEHVKSLRSGTRN
ncbi:unnamed protein product [Mytilus edulis]|uniref:Uncharacterized protein n=1 Tax=Mytilus edulis TaxID=6550 RepID=A0A8S3SSQ9_MYTED|nr:unnamed protein product [Mytilus edulis]